MNFSQLESLVALADTGSFTEAAESVHLTQSAVSHALLALERELGVTLLERNRKGVVALTSVGRTIIPHVRALLAQAEAIQQEAKAARGKTAGKLRLGSIHSFVPPQVLASLLTAFQRQYPDMEVVLFEGAMHEVGEWIDSSIVDVGFVVLPAPGTANTLLQTDELLVVVPPGHRLRARESVKPGELRDEGFIMEKTQCALHLMERAGFALRGAKPTIRYQASDTTTTLAMVAEGLGIALVPRQMLPSKLEGMAALPLDPPQPLQLGLAVKSEATASRGAALFVEVALAWAQAARE